MRFVRDEALSQHHDELLDTSERPTTIGQSATLCARCREIDIPGMVSQLQENSWRNDSRDYPIAFPPWSRQQGNTSRPDCELCTLAESLCRLPFGPKALTIGLVDEILEPQRQGSLTGKVAAALTTQRASHDLRHATLLGIHIKETLQPLYAPRTISPYSIDIAVLQEWLQECLDKHSGLCIPVKTSRLRGFRLLDCRLRCLVDAPTECQYVALSYLWGQDQDGAFNDNAFPKTIEDAISVTLLMGYHFLWIDRYCIDQSDPEQKHTQISNMDKVFSGADLVIVAAAGEDPHYGLPGISTRARKIQRTLETESFDLVEILPNANQVVSKTRWATRAWTFQEGYLAKRRLIFTDCQAIFVCGEGYRTETLTSPIAHYACQPDLSVAQYFSVRDTVYPDRCIEEYTARSMSFEGDALNAFYGVLNSWSKYTPFLGRPFNTLVAPRHHAHIWGVTTDGSWLNLGWYHEQATRRRQEFPSWSWTGWHGPVKYRKHGFAKFMISVKVGYGITPPSKPNAQSQSSNSKFWIPLQRYRTIFENKTSARHDTPRFLEITGPSPRLRLVQDTNNAWSALIPDATPHHSITCHVHWDDEDIGRHNLSGCVAMMIEKFHASSKWFLLMLPMPMGDTYERVGQMWTSGTRTLSEDWADNEGEAWEEPLWNDRTIILA